MNEAWILSDKTFADDDSAMSQNRATGIFALKEHRENFKDGSPRIIWTSGRADDGRVLLHGEETWFYPSGKKQRVATYELGVKVGREPTGHQMV
ncbi:MAG: hypothetical protein QM760_10580 [Nibricoccus sp.]